MVRPIQAILHPKVTVSPHSWDLISEPAASSLSSLRLFPLHLIEIQGEGWEGTDRQADSETA